MAPLALQASAEATATACLGHHLLLRLLLNEPWKAAALSS